MGPEKKKGKNSENKSLAPRKSSEKGGQFTEGGIVQLRRHRRRKKLESKTLPLYRTKKRHRLEKKCLPEKNPRKEEQVNGNKKGGPGGKGKDV